MGGERDREKSTWLSSMHLGQDSRRGEWEEKEREKSGLGFFFFLGWLGGRGGVGWLGIVSQIYLSNKNALIFFHIYIYIYF